jgi:hypothetical protein
MCGTAAGVLGSAAPNALAVRVTAARDGCRGQLAATALAESCSPEGLLTAGISSYGDISVQCCINNAVSTTMFIILMGTVIECSGSVYGDPTRAAVTKYCKVAILLEFGPLEPTAQG